MGAYNTGTYSQLITESGWKAIAAEARDRTCSAYRDEFSKAAERAQNEGNSRSAEFLRLLSGICSFALRHGPESAREPYGPLARWEDGSRTLLPIDLEEEQLDLLEKFVRDLEDLEFKARILDVLYVRGRGFQYAAQSVQAHLDAADFFRAQGDWLAVLRLQERAVRLAGSIRGGNVEIFETSINSTETILAGYDDFADPRMGAKVLMNLLLELDQGDPNLYRRHCEVLARIREARSHWDQARDYWDLASKWDRKAGGVNSARLAAMAAETHVQAANEALAGAQIPNTLAAGSVADAIQEFRKMGNRERADELHQWLLELQRAARDEMTSIELFEMDFAPYAAEAQAAVDGKSLIEAIQALAFICELITTKEIREIVENQMEAAPIVSRIGTVALNREGQVIAERGPLIVDGEDEQSDAIEAAMYEQARIFRGGQVLGMVEPARVKIVEQHEISDEALLPYVQSCPFVGKERATLVARGLTAGFRGDWAVAGSLLIPQLEESVRQLLRSAGDITSTLESRNVQKQQNLNKLLPREKLSELLGEDPVFHLRGLLVEQHGSNIRNRMAHGLMNCTDFNDPDVEFVWWISLCLYWPSLWTAKTAVKEDASTGDGEIELL